MASALPHTTIHGFAWSTIQNFVNHGVEFFLMLFMARLLGPKEYGIIGLTSIFLAITGAFVNSGFSNALIRKKDCSQDDFSTVFIFNFVISIICYFIIFIIAPYAADFYNEPVLSPILRVLGLQLIITGFCAVQNTILTKNIDFKKKTKISITRNIVSGFVGLYFALMGFGVWALVIQSMTSAVLFSIMLWSTTEWYPSLRFSKKSFKEMFAYGSNLLMSSLLNIIYGQIYPIVIGKVFSSTTLGNFTRARHWSSLISHNFTNIINTVTFPVLAKINDDDKRLENIYRRMIRTSCFIIFPLMIGMSAVAKPLVYVTIGEKWDFCAYILEIICFSMVWYPVHALNLNLLKVKGRSDLFFKLEIIKKILGVCIIFISVPFGIIAMCYFSILSSIISLFINTYYTGKLINVGFLKQMRDISPTLLLSMIMWAVVLIAIHFIPNIYIQLIIGIIIGATIYLAGSFIFKFPELKEVLVMYKDLKNRKK